MGSAVRQHSLRPWHLLVFGILAVAAFAWLPGRLSRSAQKAGTPQSRSADDRLRIVCTFLPVYVSTLNVIHAVPGVGAELLVSAEIGCPHSYSLGPHDARRLADADIVVSNGLGLEPFLDDLIGGSAAAGLAGAEPPHIISISDDCDVIRTGHHDEHASHAGLDHAAHDHEHASRVNPHVWVSPREAATQVRTLARELSRLDPAHAAQYERNAAEYVDRLSGLTDRLIAAARSFENREIVTFHDAFAYLARDLNLTVIATLAQDPDHAPAAAGIADVVDRIQNRRPAAIFYEPAYSDNLARTISTETGVPLYPLNPFNSIKGEPTARSYEEVMEQNLRTLQRALGGSP